MLPGGATSHVALSASRHAAADRSTSARGRGSQIAFRRISATAYSAKLMRAALPLRYSRFTRPICCAIVIIFLHRNNLDQLLRGPRNRVVIVSERRVQQLRLGQSADQQIFIGFDREQDQAGSSA